jgi:hypothetical protein
MKIVIYVLLFAFLQAESFEDYKKAQAQEFKMYQDKEDKEFAKLLSEEWKSFDISYKEKLQNRPKPIATPKIDSATNIKQTTKSKPVKIKKISSTNAKIPKKIDIPRKKIDIPKPQFVDSSSVDAPDLKTKIKDKLKEKIKDKAKEKIKDNFLKYKKVNVNFFGLKVSVEFDKKMLFYLYDVDEKSIAKFWNTISSTDYKPLISNLNELFLKYNFNDWGRYLFLQELGNVMYGNNHNKSNLFTWFVLNKMHYNVRVGFNKQKTYLLSTFSHKLYQIAFFNLNNKDYYVLTSKGRLTRVSNIKTFKQNYKNANKSFNFNMKKDIILGKSNKFKNIKVELNNKKYKFKLVYNQNRINFYRYMPQSEYDVYLSRNINNDFSFSILNALKPLVENKSEIDATNIILRFVQLAFKYKTDDAQFSYEKVMFPEETLYYPYSDCEDRAIMFKFLVNKLLDLKVVSIKFPNHLSSAVSFSTKVKGSSVIHKNKKYIMADPTYINSSVGMMAPQYKNKKFTIID